jgi:MFS family permease
MLIDNRRPASATKSTDYRPRWTLVVGCLSVALIVGSMVAFNTALPDIAITTSATQTQLNWIVDGYTVALACLLLPAGAIGDRYGRRAALLGGLLVFSSASASTALLNDPTQIVLSRVLAGAGAALAMPATLSLLSLAYPRTQRLRVIGIWAAVAGCAGLVGMVGAAVLLRFWDWRAICWALGGAAVVVLLMAATVPASRDPNAPRVDWLGSILISSGIAAAVFGLLDAPHGGWLNPVTLAIFSFGLVCVAVFVVVEKRRRTPLVDVTLFCDARFAIGVITVLLLFAAAFGLFYLGVQYAQLIMGYSPLTTALAFAPFAVPLAVLSAFSFRYAPRLGLRRTLSTGTILIVGGFFWMTTLGTHSSYLAVMVPVVVIGSGIGLCTTPATLAIMAAVGEERQGVGSAINDTAREVGAAVGIAVAGSVLAERYTAITTPQLAVWPRAVQEPASDSLGKALFIADQLGRRAGTIAEIGKDAFVTALHSSTTVLAVIVAVGAAIIICRAPRGD